MGQATAVGDNRYTIKVSNLVKTNYSRAHGTAVDPITFIVISILLLIVSVLSSYIPARRATKVDPLVALRYE